MIAAEELERFADASMGEVIRRMPSVSFGSPSSLPGRLLFAVGSAFIVILLASPLLAKILIYFSALLQQSTFYIIVVVGFMLCVLLLLFVRQPTRLLSWMIVLMSVAFIVAGSWENGWWHGFHLFLFITLLIAALTLWCSHRNAAAQVHPVASLDGGIT